MIIVILGIICIGQISRPFFLFLYCFIFLVLCYFFILYLLINYSSLLQDLFLLLLSFVHCLVCSSTSQI